MTTSSPLGITSYAYRYAVSAGRCDAWQLLERARQAGLQVVQFLDNIRLDSWSDDELRALGQAAGEIAIQVGLSGLDPGQLARYLEVATLCGADLVRATVTVPPEVAYRTLCDLLPVLRARAVVLALENHFTLTSDRLATLVARIGDPHVAVCLDVLNSIAQLQGPAETVARLAPWARCLHLKDGLTQRQGLGFRVLGAPLGEGILDLPALVRTVWAAGPRPPILLELWYEPQADEAATLAGEEEWLSRSLAYLRRLLQQIHA